MFVFNENMQFLNAPTTTYSGKGFLTKFRESREPPAPSGDTLPTRPDGWMFKLVTQDCQVQQCWWQQSHIWWCLRMLGSLWVIRRLCLIGNKCQGFTHARPVPQSFKFPTPGTTRKFMPRCLFSGTSDPGAFHSVGDYKSINASIFVVLSFRTIFLDLTLRAYKKWEINKNWIYGYLKSLAGHLLKMKSSYMIMQEQVW